MKRLLTASIVGLLGISQAMLGSAVEKERKKLGSKKFEATSLTVLGSDRAQFYLKDKKIGPFDFKGLRSSDSGRILAQKKDANVVFGVLHKERQGNEEIFALKFDKDWKNPEIFFEYPLVGGGAIKQGSEVIKLTDDAIVVAAVTEDGQGLSFFKVNFAGKDVKSPSGMELGRPEYEGMRIDKITALSNKKVTYQLNNGEKRSTSFALNPLAGEIPSSYEAFD